MSSIKEKMKYMPRLIADAGEECVLEIKHNGQTVAEVIIVVSELNYEIGGKSDVKLSSYNPDSIDNKNIIIQFPSVKM